jgi:murein DD-endopeptidase MepM/ murein hydrolase activator NlpD
MTGTAVGAQPPAEGTAHLDQVKLRGPHRAGSVPASIDLGNEPPLSVDGELGIDVDRRRVSVQWFSGTILTGLCGAALMGGAVFASLDGETNFATSAERFEAALRNAVDKTASRKSNRLPPVGEANAARQLIPISTINKVGNREVVRKSTLVRVETNLSLTTTELSAKIPPFNPQRMLADSETNAANTESTGAEPDAEVSFVTRDLAGVLPRVRVAAMVPIDDVISRVRDAANWTGSVAPTTRFMVASMQPGAGPKFSYATEGLDDPYANIGVRGVPENVTLLPKTTTQTTGGTGANERTVMVKKGDSVASILRDLGATPDDIKAIIAALGARGRDGAVKEGLKLRVLLSPTPGSQRLQPARVVLLGDAGVEAVVALSDMGKFVAVDVQSADTPIADAGDDDEDDASGVRLYQSIYETALRNQIPRAVVDELIRIYSYDVDFQRKAQAGDSFAVLYAGEGEAPSADAKNEVLYAALTVGGETKKFYRYQSPDDGVVDYYDETGKSAKKFLVRKPVGDGIMRSGFGARKHPVLGYVRAHTGVDWAAPLGTPIYASGNGTIEKMGWEGGYGRYIRMRHTNGYETAYGHMSAFAKGIDVGKTVRQGQIIGFVGSTGLSTGPHLHYEIIINTRFVDPMKVKLPRGRVLDGTALAGFDKERTRFDGIMTQSATRTASR